MATATRLWASLQDSGESIENRYRDSSVAQLISARERKYRTERTFSQKSQEPKVNCRASCKSLSRIDSLASPKRLFNTEATTPEVTRVKKSALLYEITERTNTLAKPKALPITSSVPRPKVSSRVSLPTISRLTERVSELSRPKTFYVPITRPPGYIAPTALRAIATQRILELATPRKMKSPRPPRRHGIIHGPCSSRISYLARPKHNVNSKAVQRSFLKRGVPSRTTPPPWELPGSRVWKELGYSSSVVKRCAKMDRETKRKTRMKSGRTAANDKPIKHSLSNASVLSLTEVRAGGSARRRLKKFSTKLKRRRNRARKFARSVK